MLCSFLGDAENELVSIDSQGRVVVNRLSFVSPDEDLKVETLFNVAIEGVSEHFCLLAIPDFLRDAYSGSICLSSKAI